MLDKTYNVLFLCTGNSARSIMAEAVMNHRGAGKFHAFSAGSHPKGQIHRETAKLLRGLGYPVFEFRSKSWVEFMTPGAPVFDFVFTVCDNAAEACPTWPGQPMTARWSVPDPAAATGTAAEIAAAFEETYRLLDRRIASFMALPLDALDRFALQGKLDEIGRMEGATAA
ncbi:MAG: arsenate reductase ArsC [Xanthobacteraceae bacterium]|nr:arsenate reductase ArsC [Xanthobacteraceae bacterium]